MANPRGEGTFVYVSRTRFFGVERYLIWLALDGRVYALNRATKNVTPQLPWPRDAAEIMWARTGLDPFVATEAIDRALAKLDWPDVAGKSLVIQLGAPEESYDRDYLLRSVEIEVAQRGGVVVDDEDQAGYELNVLVGAIGVDRSGRFFGVQGTQAGGLIPFTIPELVIYKTQRRDGFAKLALALLDHRSGGVVHRSGPELGASYARTRTLISTENPVVDPAAPDAHALRLAPGSTFAVVNGLGGAGIASQERCLPTSFPYGCAGEWAKLYAADQGARPGVLFVTFHVDGDPRLARGVFLNVEGQVVDTFEIRSELGD